MINKYGFVFFLIIFSYSCVEKIENRIASYIQTNCILLDTMDSCEIDLKKAIGIDWDEMHIFPEWTMPEDIEEELGVNYNGTYVKDDMRRFVFVKNQKIIYEENSETFDSSISFNFIDWPVQILKYKTSQFKIVKKQENKKIIYLLSQIETARKHQ